MSAFGGIVAVNRPVPAALAEALAPVFTEVVVAPGLRRRRARGPAGARRTSACSRPRPPRPTGSTCARSTAGCWCRSPILSSLDRAEWRVVTETRADRRAQWADLELAWAVCAAVTSNAIVLAKGGQAVGIGAGQQNRVDSARIAADKAAGRAKGGACASDAFFPFRDGLDARRRRRRRAPSSSPAARCATTRSSPPPTSTASPWSSPASATSATERNSHYR